MNKQAFFLVDFNIDLLNYTKYQTTSEFLDSLSSNPFIPCILQSTRLTTYSKTVIDKILSNSL